MLTADLILIKRVNIEPIFTAKIIEWIKFIDDFGLNIEADPSRMGKKKVFCTHWVYTKPLICTAPYIK